MKRYLMAAAAAGVLLLLLFLLLEPAEKKRETVQRTTESVDTIAPLPIQRKRENSTETGSGDKISEAAGSLQEKEENGAAFSPSTVDIDSESNRKMSIGEMKELTYRKREDEARAKGPEALERFYEREKQIAERKAAMKERNKAQDAYFKEKEEWIKQMAKARKEGDVAKIMELEKERPVPPYLKKKRSENR